VLNTRSELYSKKSSTLELKTSTEDWTGELNSEDGKLYCPRKFPMSLPQLVMKLTGGIKEKNLTLVMMGVEALAELAAISLLV